MRGKGRLSVLCSKHAKTFAIDREQLFVGSYNWDGRSRNIDTEMGIMISSSDLAGRMVDSVFAALANSAWKLRLNAKGHVEWVDVDENGGEVVFDRAPQSTVRQRFEAGITGIKAIEGEL